MLEETTKCKLYLAINKINHLLNGASRVALTVHLPLRNGILAYLTQKALLQMSTSPTCNIPRLCRYMLGLELEAEILHRPQLLRLLNSKQVVSGISLKWGLVRLDLVSVYTHYLRQGVSWIISFSVGEKRLG